MLEYTKISTAIPIFPVVSTEYQEGFVGCHIGIELITFCIDHIAHGLRFIISIPKPFRKEDIILTL
jgi:hypothetical protein